MVNLIVATTLGAVFGFVACHMIHRHRSSSSGKFRRRLRPRLHQATVVIPIDDLSTVEHIDIIHPNKVTYH